MKRRGQSRDFLKKLRKKYRLGEFRKSRRTSRRNRARAARARATRALASRARVTRALRGSLGPVTSNGAGFGIVADAKLVLGETELMDLRTKAEKYFDRPISTSEWEKLVGIDTEPGLGRTELYDIARQ